MQVAASVIALLCAWLAPEPTRGSTDLALCQKACSTPPELTSEGTQLLKHLCGCVGDLPFDPFAYLDMTTEPATTPQTRSVRVKQTTTTTATPEPVTSICDYLCSHQMGGDACRCSNPSLPGR